MKNRSIAIRFFGLFMLVAVLLNSITSAQAVVSDQIATQQKAANDDASSDKESEISFSEWTSDVVVPSHAFSFNTNLIVVPAPEFNFIFSETVAYKISKPLYRHSYFEKLYEHHIAINAP